jgi:hypothetical protein
MKIIKVRTWMEIQSWVVGTELKNYTAKWEKNVPTKWERKGAK